MAKLNFGYSFLFVIFLFVLFFYIALFRYPRAGTGNKFKCKETYIEINNIYHDRPFYIINDSIELAYGNLVNPITYKEELKYNGLAFLETPFKMKCLIEDSIYLVKLKNEDTLLFVQNKNNIIENKIYNMYPQTGPNAGARVPRVPNKKSKIKPNL